MATLQDLELDHIRLEMLDPNEEGYEQTMLAYYVIRLGQLTPRRLGLVENSPYPLSDRQKKIRADGMDRLLTSIPWPVFATWMQHGRVVNWAYDDGPPGVSYANRQLLLERNAPSIHRVLRWFADDPINERYAKYLLPPSDDAAWWNIPTHVPEGEEFAGEEIYLALMASNPEIDVFENYYGRTHDALKLSLVEAQVSELDRTLGKNIRRMRRRMKKAENELTAPMGEVLQKLETGDRLFNMVIDFGRSKEWRKQNWYHMYREEQYAVPQPDGARMHRTERLRDQWRSDLLKPCARAMVESRTGGTIDDAAGAILGCLRDPSGPVLTMFANWDDLYPPARAKLVHMTLDGLRLAVRGKKTLQELIDGEFAALATAFGLQDEAVGPGGPPPLSPSAREELLHGVIENLDVAAMFPGAAPTPFGKFLAEKLKSSTSAISNGAIALDALGLATPYITGAMRAFDRSGVHASAWGWRVLVKTTGLDGEAQREIWDELEGVLSTPGKRPSKPLPTMKLIAEGKVTALVGSVGPVLKLANIISTSIVMFEAAERCQHKGVEPGLKELSILMGLMKETAELVNSPGLHRLMGATVKEAEFLSKSTTVAKAVPFVGVAVDTLALAVAIQEARTSTTWNKAKREKLIDNALLDGVALGISIASIAFPPIAILGLLVYATKDLLTNPDHWTYVIPGTASKPHTHQYVEALLGSLVPEEEPPDPKDEPGKPPRYKKEQKNPLLTAIAALTSPNGIMLRNNVVQMDVQYADGISSSAQRLWEIGGHSGKHFEHYAREIARVEYGFPRPVATTIVRPS